MNIHLSPFFMQVDKQEPIFLENLKNLCRYNSPVTTLLCCLPSNQSITATFFPLIALFRGELISLGRVLCLCSAHSSLN